MRPYSSSSKPNVLLLVDSFEVGGAETQMLLLARLLATSGRYNVHLACFKRSGPLLDQAAQLGITDIPEFPLTSFYNWNGLVQMRRFIRFLRQREISVVHTEGFYTNVFGLIGAWLARVPARVGFRGSVGGWLSPQQERLERIAFRFASVVQANADAVKSFLVSQGVPAQRVVVVHYGLDLSAVAVPPNLSRADALQLLNLPTSAQRRFVSIVANLHNPIKNYPMFLRMAARVREEVPAAAFVIAGEGALMSELRELARELGLEEHVFFIGRCERVAELLFASDVCVLSSKGEGFSRSILEYMGAGRPVVATDVGGAREVIIEGKTGYLVQSGDHENMAARIVSLLNDQAKACAMGERGQKVVHEKFSAQVQLVQTERLYDELLAASHRGKADLGAAMKPLDRTA